MNKLQETLDGIPPDLLRSAIEQILGVLYDHQLEAVCDRMQEPEKYGGDFDLVDLKDVGTAVRIVEAEGLVREEIACSRREGDSPSPS